MSKRIVLNIVGAASLIAAGWWFLSDQSDRAERARLQSMHDSVDVTWKLENLTREMQGLPPKAAPAPMFASGDPMPVYIGCSLLVLIGSMCLIAGISLPNNAKPTPSEPG